MGALIDDISRIIASPLSRRQAFKLVTGSVGGAVLASMGFGRSAWAQKALVSSCPDSEVLCNGNCYPPHSTCCGNRLVCNAQQICCSNSYCCSNTTNCCGTSCCPKTQICCGGICCNVRTPCCGTMCCPTPRSCCNGVCCVPFSSCCGGQTCCPPGSYCCGTQCKPTQPSPSTGCVQVPARPARF